MISRVEHVCFLVDHLSAARSRLPASWSPQPPEEQAGEGAREQYVVPPPPTPWVLLVQAIANGPYRSAMRKRGPGLHHIAISVADLKASMLILHRARLLIHPLTVGWMGCGTVWACRPGLPFLIEVMQAPSGQSQSGEAGHPLRIEVPLETEWVACLNLVLDGLLMAGTGLRLWWDGGELPMPL